MFYYKIYGKIVGVNLKLTLLKMMEECNACDLYVDVSYESLEGENVYIKGDAYKFDIRLGSLALYRIFPEKNMISCTAQNYESFFSTFFNIPFSVYFLSKNEVLFHACSVLYHHQILCLTGDKGVGKSTLMSLLDKLNGFEIFSDDTLHVDGSFFGDRAHNLAKQLPETIRALNIRPLNEKNIAGKAYTYFPCAVERARIGAIFHLNRTKEKGFRLQKITTDLNRNTIFRANIVGISYMPHQLILKSLRIHPKNDMDIYELYIPDDLRYVVANSERLKTMLLQTALAK